MEEMNLSQIERQIDMQAGEQLKQIKQKLIESLPSKVDWHFQEQVRKVSEEIWQKTGIGNNYREGVQDKFDNYGYLLNPEDWSTGIAEHLAREEGVEITEAHWEIIRFMREYYEEYRITIDNTRLLARAISKKFGPEKGNKEYLYKLFPVSHAAQASKIAGLPRIGGCV